MPFRHGPWPAHWRIAYFAPNHDVPFTNIGIDLERINPQLHVDRISYVVCGVSSAPSLRDYTVGIIPIYAEFEHVHLHDFSKLSLPKARALLHAYSVQRVANIHTANTAMHIIALANCGAPHSIVRPLHKNGAEKVFFASKDPHTVTPRILHFLESLVERQ